VAKLLVKAVGAWSIQLNRASISSAFVSIMGMAFERTAPTSAIGDVVRKANEIVCHFAFLDLTHRSPLRHVQAREESEWARVIERKPDVTPAPPLNSLKT
jgi:hypothetical protein